MVERIKALLAARQLSPTQFADTIGVARPIISHILGGRNKPSLEVVQKIIAAFSDLSLPWLLNGTGDMFASTASPEPAPAPVTAPKRASASATTTPPDRAPTFGRTERPGPPIAPAAPAQEQPELPTTSARLSTGASPAPATPGNPPESQEEPIQPASRNVEAEGAASSTALPSTAGTVYRPTNLQAALKAPVHQEAGKTIRRIVIFYTDGSFADYLPE